jgi:LytS/YehU family sensor histidine kinase
MLQAYLDIERTRWQSGLMARIEIDPAARGEPLPQFLLLPLLENAIKYGGKTSPALLEVVVSARVEDDELVCEVANTGEWVELNGETPRESTRIGLENLRRRIARHYGLGRDVHVAKGGGWVRVTLRLPRVARAAESETAAG